MPAKPPDEAGPARGKPKKAAKPCPICGKNPTELSRPFCSERCRDVDLNRWLSDSYRIPAAKDDDEDAD
jgi:endogenous inhibitor of DNA gyrase (YacG/DUF329 family)